VPDRNRDPSDRQPRNVAHWLTDYGHITVTVLDVDDCGACSPVDPNTLPDGRDNRARRQRNRQVQILLQNSV